MAVYPEWLPALAQAQISPPMWNCGAGSAIRVDTRPERKRVLYERLLCPYYNNNSFLTKRLTALHGIP